MVNDFDGADGAGLEKRRQDAGAAAEELPCNFDSP
jgi:hypothetical protein